MKRVQASVILRFHLEAVGLEKIRGVVAVSGWAGARSVVGGAGPGGVVARAGGGVGGAGGGVNGASSGVNGARGGGARGLVGGARGVVGGCWGAVLPRFGVPRLSGVSDVSDEAGVAVDVVGDGLSPTVREVHGV